jgi:16S rRNA (guanine(527)-N(7))-methyltransferase RsmG
MSISDDELRAATDPVARQIPALASTPLHDYLRELLQWNDELGLVSKRDPLAACIRLVIESAELGDMAARALTSSEHRVADVGSGAGFPGVVWSFLFPQWDLVLIERREKKAAFLERVVRRLSLAKITVLAADARDATRIDSFARSFDLVATMAVGEPVRTAPQIEDLLTAEGHFITTVPADAEIPERCGRTLFLEDDVHAQFGRYARYRNRV